jgi:hypothetical protein
MSTSGRRRGRRERAGRIIAERRRRQQQLPQQAAQARLATALDNLNAASMLEERQRRVPSSLLCYGPKALRGSAPVNWAAAVIWYRRAGHHHYKTLSLLGIWALQDGNNGGAQIIVGTRALAFTGAFYNPESYFYHLPRGFETYYGREAGPPPGATRLLDTAYDPGRRLQLRREIEAALLAWAERHLLR